MLGGLKGRHKDLAMELVAFIQRQEDARIHLDDISRYVDDRKKEWLDRVSSAFVFGYYNGFIREASVQFLNKASDRYKTKFMQYAYDNLGALRNSGIIISKTIRATNSAIFARDKEEGYSTADINKHIQATYGRDLLDVEMFCHGRYAGKVDLYSYANRTNCELQLKRYLFTGEYDTSDIDGKMHLDVRYQFFE